MRAVSTVVDATVFLLLVSAAVAALAVQPTPEPANGADETATALARTTANVSFTVADARDRRVSGTHAALLARAALGNLRLDGHRLAPASGDFRAAVRNETRRALAWSSERTSVTAVWEPYRDAPVWGRIRVGTAPPPGADVAVATLRAPVPVEDCRRGTEESYEAVARTVADCLLDATLGADAAVMPDPSSRAGRAVLGRLQAYEAALGVRADGAGGRVESALAARLVAHMRERFESPAAAAAAVRTGTARIVIREWEQ